MQIQELKLPGVFLISPRVFKDNRGFFVETYQAERYRKVGIDVTFVQDNHSRSAERTLRGLHYQSSPGQAKLVRVGAGRIYDVVVDIRADSPTFGQWDGVYLDAEQHEQLFVPIGFAHGFCVVSEMADVIYKVSAPYDAATERGIAYDDPTLGVEWPVSDPILSARDQKAESFLDFARRHGRDVR
jgi:dTDP-4-dehydrorhamnose 3,5-epimerase